MALVPNELWGTPADQSGHLRAAPYDDGVLTGKIAIVSGAPVLPRLTPLAFNEATGSWQVWSAGIGTGTATNEVQSYNLGGPTSGTYTLTFDGQTTGTIAFNAAAATIQTALDALSNIDTADVTVSGGPSNTTTVVVTFDTGGVYAGVDVPVITIDDTLLVGGTGAPAAATSTTQGEGSTNVFVLSGFLWEDDFQTSATGEVLGNILIKGIVHRDDVPVPTGESQDDLDNAMRDDLRTRGIIVQGITGFH